MADETMFVVWMQLSGLLPSGSMFLPACIPVSTRPRSLKGTGCQGSDLLTPLAWTKPAKLLNPYLENRLPVVLLARRARFLRLHVIVSLPPAVMKRYRCNDDSCTYASRNGLAKNNTRYLFSKPLTLKRPKCALRWMFLRAIKARYSKLQAIFYFWTQEISKIRWLPHPISILKLKPCFQKFRERSPLVVITCFYA